MKIDVEGYEGFVIDGAKEALPKIETLVMEFSPALLKKAGTDSASMFRTLSAHFSHIYRIGDTDLVEVTSEECLGSGNQVELLFER